jgi:hypothetical protein
VLLIVVTMGPLQFHLDLKLREWWQWKQIFRQGYVAWTQFIAEIYERFDNDTHHLGHLTNLKQYGMVEEFIDSFEKFDFRTYGMSDVFLK